ncbi:MAG TPA: Gfo/Idh/MocA family oxidoreductase [Abditibacteriaceae bacterium]|jgi:predicted dehydrogenase
MADKVVRIGLIGTGGIGQAHIQSLQQIPEAQIVALCDIDEQRVRAVAEPLDVPFYTDSAKMIAEAKMDALYVCVLPDAHGEIEIQAARKGLHLFVEKPVNLYLDQAQRVWEEIKKAGVMTQSGYSLRYLPGSVQLKQFLEDKAVGTAHVIRWNGLPGTPWWRKYDQSGGQLVEMTTHQVDLLRWVMGEVEAVSASYSFRRLFTDQPDVTVPDTQVALLHFRSGASATISTSCAIGQGSRGEVEFVIKDARVTWQGDGIKLAPEGSYTLPPLPHETSGIDAAFVQAVANNDRSFLHSPYDDALRSVAVTLAANLSAENGGRLVKLDEVLGPLA